MFYIKDVIGWLLGTTIAVVPNGNGGYYLVNWSGGRKILIK